jgi:hypothetical protein
VLTAFSHTREGLQAIRPRISFLVVFSDYFTVLVKKYYHQKSVQAVCGLNLLNKSAVESLTLGMAIALVLPVIAS